MELTPMTRKQYEQQYPNATLSAAQEDGRYTYPDLNALETDEGRRVHVLPGGVGDEARKGASDLVNVITTMTLGGDPVVILGQVRRGCAVAETIGIHPRHNSSAKLAAALAAHVGHSGTGHADVKPA